MNFIYFFLTLFITNKNKIQKIPVGFTRIQNKMISDDQRNEGINNIKKNKLCKNCIYYKPYFAYSEYIPLLSRCRRFSYEDKVSNEIMNDYAIYCRNEEDKCGKLGKCFESRRLDYTRS